MTSIQALRPVGRSGPSRADAGTATDAARERLLGLTLRHAVANSPYYRERLSGLIDRVQTLDDLRLLPLLEKRSLSERLDDMRTFDRYPDFLLYTSGTTGEPLAVPVYREELEANERLLIEPVVARFAEPPPLTLTIVRVGHGSHVLSGTLPALPCHINYGLDQMLWMLGRPHWVNGKHRPVTQIEANVLNIRQVTDELLESGRNPADLGVRVLLLSGWYLPPSERETLGEVWDADVFDRYGVTEVNGDGKWCPVCRGYHFDFTTVPEVLDLDTGEPVVEGIGRFVLTGLYPFNQAVPKIRYDIGDLVEIGPALCGSAQPAIRFLSRLRDAVPRPAPQTGFALYPTEVADVLAPLPDVARKPHTGFLKFRLSSTEARPRLEVELTYAPAAFPERVAQLRATVVDALHSRRSDLTEVDVEFVRPGAIADITKV